MKQIYLIFTDTGTLLSKIIKTYTKEKYAHVSLSLDEKLEQMYSFGRIHPYIAFWGGFVHEEVHRGTFKRFKNTDAIIAKLDVTDEQFEILKNMIQEFKISKRKYSFNTLGLFAVAIKKRIKRKKAFYCAEFVKYMLDTAKIDNNLPDIIRPQDFMKIKEIHYTYEGKLNKYI